MAEEISLLIRPTREEDVIRLADMADQLGHPSTVEQIRERFEILTKRSDSNVIFVAEADRKTVGWVHAHIYNMLVDDPKLEIGGLVVDEKFRGNGIGAKLMQAVEAWAIEKGCFSVYIRSNVIRTRAHEFYKRIGYSMIKSHYIFRKVLK
jgi:GNAT superfamily N-acetyltransferase